MHERRAVPAFIFSTIGLCLNAPGVALLIGEHFSGAIMRKSLLAAFTIPSIFLASLSSAAFAQDAARPPLPLQDNAPNTYRYDDSAPPSRADDRALDDRTPSERAADDRAARDARAEDRADQASAWQRRDVFCRRDAAGRTGYEAREAARDEQARGSIGGTLGGAALGAIIGGAAGDAGTGAAIGAGAGILAGSAIGADNARRAAADVEADYGDAYHACMDTAQDDDIRDYGDRGRYASDYPPPPVYYRPYPGPYYPPYPRFYSPSFGFSFGFGGGNRGFYGPRSGFRGGYRGRR